MNSEQKGEGMGQRKNKADPKESELVEKASSEDEVILSEAQESTESESTEEIVAEAVAETDGQDSEADEEVVVEPQEEQQVETTLKDEDVTAKTRPKRWLQIGFITLGLGLTLLIFVVGLFSQIYKGKTLPSVSVAGISSSAKSEQQLKDQLSQQANSLQVTFTSGKKTLKPSNKEIGLTVDVERTVENAIAAKRDDVFSKFMFWRHETVPAVVSVNNTLLSRYVEAKLPKLTKSGQDARLEYNSSTNQFEITNHKDGVGPDTVALKANLEEAASNLEPVQLQIKTTNKPARITEGKLETLVEPANELIERSIMLEAAVGTYQTLPADIAQWITPTPEKDGTVKLVIDKAKVQSYVESIGKRISSAPQDKKVIKDKKTGKVVVLQDGRDGTELAGKEELASKIADAVSAGQDITLSMSIKTAKHKTVNLKGYDKWIEVDLSEQRTTAYEGAKAIKSFVIASGMAGYETPVGEYSIWLKVRKQTMQGGSKADGSYYNLPNVEWVSYFYQDYALHGAYWRKVFGVPGSHGCVNMTNADAQWVYNWAPVGTKVIVHY